MTRNRPTPSLLIAVLALVVALCGTTVAGYAAGKANGNHLIKKKTLSGNRLKSDTVTGEQVDESGLAKVPSAGTADTAGTAGTAGSAARADQVPAGVLQPFTFNAGWQNDIVFSHRPPGYRKDAAGYVHLQGMVTRSSGSDKALAVLPVGFRPSGVSYFTTSSGSSTTYVYVSPDGRVNVEAGDFGNVSLDPVTFLAEG